MDAAKLLIFGDGPVALSLALGAQKLGFFSHLVRCAPSSEFSQKKDLEARDPRAEDPSAKDSKAEASRAEDPKSPPPKNKNPKAKDPRAWALTPGSLKFLRDLGLPLSHQAPLAAMEVWHADGSGAALPGALALKKEGVSLGAVLPNAPLRREFEAAIQAAKIPTTVIAAGEPRPNPLALCADRAAALALICDPAWAAALPPDHQPSRSRWDYDQIALTAPITLDRPHGGVARQVFLPSGPLAALPLPEPNRASLIWSLSKDRWQGIREQSNLPALVRACLGMDLTFDSNDLSTFPLRADHASTYLGPRFALLGDAAHRIHPLAGQGLNLGLADVGALLDTLVQARSVGSDVGSPLSLRHFERQRRPQNEAMRAATDSLKTLFGHDLGPIRLIRSLGLSAFDASPLKPKLLNWMSDPSPLSHALNHLTDAPAQAA